MDEPNGREDRVTAALDEFESRLVAYAVRITGDVHAARDVVQETFLRFVAEDPRRIERVKPWLYTVCRRICLDELRKERRMDSASEAVLDGREGRESDPADRAATRDEAVRAESLLADLPTNQREVLELKFRHGLMYREIADVTGLSAGNVGFLIHTALKTLRERMAHRVRAAGGGR
jgi:RNA polymerase sigma factor (sigma-70 family)